MAITLNGVTIGPSNQLASGSSGSAVNINRENTKDIEDNLSSEPAAVTEVSSSAKKLTGTQQRLSQDLLAIDTAKSALGEIKRLQEDVKSLADEARSTADSARRNDLDTEVGVILNRIDEVQQEATFNGENLLDGGELASELGIPSIGDPSPAVDLATQGTAQEAFNDISSSIDQIRQVENFVSSTRDNAEVELKESVEERIANATSDSEQVNTEQEATELSEKIVESVKNVAAQAESPEEVIVNSLTPDGVEDALRA